MTYARGKEVLASQLIAAQDAERQRVSRELHDGIVQHLAHLSMKIDKLSRVKPADFQRDLTIVRILAARCIRLARDIAHELHPSIIDDLGLVAALQNLCDEFGEREDISVTFTHDVIPQWASTAASCFYRIAQQTLRNVIQHARAAHVSVHVASREGVVVLIIEDDGVGFDTDTHAPHGSLGLVNMRERARLAGGTFMLTSRPREGTKIVVKICREPPR